jgi:excisionase family DNA binding protein
MSVTTTSTVERGATRLLRALVANQSATGAVRVAVGDATVVVPGDVAQRLIDLLSDLGEGRDVVPASADLLVGTELAADVLGVSRQWVVELADRGSIPAVRVGSKRRIRLGDLDAFRRNDDARRRLSWEFLDDADDIVG